MDDSDENELAFSDKHIVIKDGHLATKFFGQSELTIHDSKGPVLSDGKWHQVEVIQISGHKCIFRVDGKQVGEHALQTIDIKDKSVKNNDTMQLGFSILMGQYCKFTGSLKNLIVCRYNENEQFKDDLWLTCFETDGSAKLITVLNYDSVQR